MSDKTDTCVSIGVGDNIDPDKRDGIAWVKSTNGGTTQKSFIVDKPETLKNNDEKVTKTLFEQLLKMGMIPIYLEVFYKNTRRLYRHGYYEMPVYVDVI